MNDVLEIQKENYIETTMKKFKLVDMREQYAELILEAQDNSLSYLDFLIRLLAVEEEGKKNRRFEKLLEKARFESVPSLEEINYKFNPTLESKRIS